MKLEKQARNAINKGLKNDIEAIKLAKTIEQLTVSWWFKRLLTGKQYKKLLNGELSIKQAKNIMEEKATKNRGKQLLKTLEEITNIKNAECIKWGRVDVSWVRNNRWGYCPNADYRNGHVFEHFKSVTGCGYDKLSTLTANILNADVHFKKYLFDYCEKHHINNNNISKKLGYGVRMFHGIPYFEGAVGIDCHISILKKMGFDVRYYSLKNAELLEFTLKK